MILINLLPHREAARKKQRELFGIHLALALAAGALVSGGIYLYYQARIDAQLGRNNFLKAEIVKLDAQIKDIATLQSQLDALKARQAAVESLQADRNLPVHLLNEMVKQLPEGVYLTSLKQDKQTIVLNGVAQSQERVSELLRNLGNGSEWLTKPELVEIVAATVNLSPREQRRVSNFAIRVSLKRDEAQPTKDASPAPKKPAGKA